ncbi:MAG: hypothetical protein N4A45_03430 [Flavobacteriales bacterium]|jgi:hypothetical protein|nr:hypothetical protein [Flavobacteriales bacterium]
MKHLVYILLFSTLYFSCKENKESKKEPTDYSNIDLPKYLGANSDFRLLNSLKGLGFIRETDSLSKIAQDSAYFQKEKVIVEIDKKTSMRAVQQRLYRLYKADFALYLFAFKDKNDQVRYSSYKMGETFCQSLILNDSVFREKLSNQQNVPIIFSRFFNSIICGMRDYDNLIFIQDSIIINKEHFGKNATEYLRKTNDSFNNKTVLCWFVNDQTSYEQFLRQKLNIWSIYYQRRRVLALEKFKMPYDSLSQELKREIRKTIPMNVPVYVFSRDERQDFLNYFHLNNQVLLPK